MIKFFSKIDFLLLGPAFFLSCLGLLIIYSISFESDPSFFIRQAIYILLAIICYLIIQRLDFKLVSHISYLLLFIVLLILVVTYFIGIETLGSTRWINLGFFTLQGSELAKPVLLVTLAYFFAKHSPTQLKNILISFLIMAPIFLLIFNQPDLGSSVIILLIWGFSIFIAGLNLVYLGGLGILTLVSLPLIWNQLHDYQKTRVITFLNPEVDPQGASYNLVQALIAFGSGELTGRGLGRGTQSHLDFLPAGKTDFILAATGEELGFLGICLILLLFSFLIYRIMALANGLKDKGLIIFTFSAAFTLFAQFVINAGMNMGLLPITGITLPFISFGGSSLISTYIILGLVQSIKNRYIVR